MKRAAYFLLDASYQGRPLDDGVVRALLNAGYAVDLYYPSPPPCADVFPADRVRNATVAYRSGWLARHLLSPSWRRYDLFLGTPDLAVATAGALATFARRPVVTVCDEIFSGGYAGRASPHWKRMARRAMRRARFTVITDLCRCDLHRRHAGLRPPHRFLTYPCCYSEPFIPARSRVEVRAALGVDAGDYVVAAAGRFANDTGATWVVRLLERLPADVRLLVQPGGQPDPLVNALLADLARRDRRLIYLPGRRGFRESLDLTNAADAALALYLSDKPQFQLMGVSSNKVCTALWMGKPVIATDQPSLRFLLDYACGALVQREEDLLPAIERLRADTAAAANCARCMAEYIQPREKLTALIAAFAAL